jgi:hypothetical protein
MSLLNKMQDFQCDLKNVLLVVFKVLKCIATHLIFFGVI